MARVSEPFDHKRFDELCKKDGRSNTQIGALIGVSEGMVSKYRSGNRAPGRSPLLKFCKLVKVQPNELRPVGPPLRLVSEMATEHTAAGLPLHNLEDRVVSLEGRIDKISKEVGRLHSTLKTISEKLEVDYQESERPANQLPNAKKPTPKSRKKKAE